MKNATNRYKLFPVENLPGTWGSCGSNTSGLTLHDRLPLASQTQTRRVGGNPTLHLWRRWGARGLQLGTPTTRPSGEILPFVSEGWSQLLYLEVADMRWAEHNQTLKTPSLYCKRQGQTH